MPGDQGKKRVIEHKRKSYDELRATVDEFLNEHHPSKVLPVPIEEIIEFRLGLDIIPIPGLRDMCSAEGFLTRGLAICVDQFISQERENRFRYTLAYETGRYLLQRDLVAGSEIDGVESYRDWHECLPERVWKDTKFECYDFAGLLLVLTAHLRREAAHVRISVFDQFRRSNLNPDSNLTIIWSRIAADLADRVFKVSDSVMKKRLHKERLVPEGLLF